MKNAIVIFLLLSLLCGSGGPALAQNRFDGLLDSARSSSTLKHAHWGVFAEFVDSDSVLLTLNADKSLAPASCLKLVTTAAAFELLGEDYTFTTRVYSSGKLTRDGILHGNIIIVGGGDPTLGSNRVPGSLGLDSLMRTWVGAVRAKGIRRISGSVLGDDFAYDRVPIPDTWFWIDIGNYYATSTSALTLHDNLYDLVFRPGARVGKPAKVLRTDPVVPGLRFENSMRTGAPGSGDNGYIYLSPGQWNAVLRGTVPAGSPEFTIRGSIPDPPLFAAQMFASSLIAAGIRIDGKPSRLPEAGSYDSASLIARTVSPPIRDIVTIINKESFNLYAEQLLKEIGRKVSNEGSTEKGIDAIQDLLDSLHVDADGLHLADGSGLSHTNGITAHALVGLLRAMKRSAHFDAYYRSLSVAGDSTDIGYFKDFGVGTEVAHNARIKSGTIQGVRSYAGYVTDRAGRLIAFAMIANNYAGRASYVDAIHREIVLRLARLE